MTASNHDLDVDVDAPDTDAKAPSDHLDPAAFDEEPWSDLDPEAFEDPEDAELPVSFGGPVPLRDTRTRERWLQSALQALVAPTLGVDGVLGPRTSEAVARFQRRAKALVGKVLRVDGIAGRDTIAALEVATSSTAPALAQPAKVAAAAPAPSTRSGGLVLREVVDGKGVTWHHLGAGGPIRRYVTSERGLAVIVRLHNWMPAHVVRWSNRFIAELEAASPGRDLSDPFEWDQALEDAFVQKICDERRRVKSGSYDGYARGLSTTRGSFVGGTEAT